MSSNSPNLQNLLINHICIDSIDIKILKKVYFFNSGITTRESKILNINYFKLKRKLEKLTKLDLLVKLDKSPAIYSINLIKYDNIRLFIVLWEKILAG